MRRRIIAGLLAINLFIGLPVTDTFAGQSIVQVQTDTDVSVSDVQQTTNVTNSEKSDIEINEKPENSSNADNEQAVETPKSDNSEEMKNADETDTAGDQLNGEQTETDKDAVDSTEKDKTEETKGTETVEAEEEAPTTEQIEATETTETTEEPELALFALNTVDYLDIAKCFGVKYNAANNTVQIENRMDFIMLSNCDPAIVAKLTININGTAANSTLDLEKKDGDTYEFRGIGDENHPFCGKIESTGITKIQTNTTFFGGLSADAKVANAIKIVWDGDGSVPMLAGTYVISGTGEYKLPENLSIESAEADTVKMGGLIGTVKCADPTASGTLVLGSFVSYKNVAVNVSNGNAGLICNTLESGAIRLEAGALPTTAWSISGSGDAGGLIGHMNAGTNLELAIADGSADKLTVTSTAGNAGGIAGVIDDGAAVILKSNFTLSNLNVTGTTSGGGVAGTTSNDAVKAEGDSKLTMTAPTVKAKGVGSSAGGFYGDYTVSNANVDAYPQYVEIDSVNVTVQDGKRGDANGGNAGGIFGTLQVNTNYKIDWTNNKLFKAKWTAGSAEGYGAVIGQVISDNRTCKLILQKISLESYYVKDGNRSNYQGGIIGRIGSADKPVYVEMNNIEVYADMPFAASTRGFGGVAGQLTAGSILKAVDLTVKTNKNPHPDYAIWEGGGLVGYAGAGSVLELSGTTDISGARFNPFQNKYVGQLVGAQDNALIYARGDGNGNGWTFNRSTTAYKVNDIGNYGEILRLKDANGTATIGLSTDLITITADHKVTLKAPSAAYGENEISIASVDDFALLAIAWNSQGYFSADAGNINSQTWKKLFTKNITLTADIDLTGTGIIGLTRDNRIGNDTTYSYQGTFDGRGNTIIMAAGETFGLRGDSAASGEGSGQLYSYCNDSNCHTDIGLFAQAGGIIQNLTIGGSIAFSTFGGWGNAGGIAGRTYGTGVQVSNVTAEEAITLTQAVNGKTTYIGGFYGENNVSVVTIDQNSYAKARIELNVASGNADSVQAGGMIGTSQVNAVINCDAAIVGGSITSDSTKKLCGGGLIATIPNGGTVTVNIRDLSVDAFAISAENASETCGGFLGYSWNNAQVNFSTNTTGYALKVKNAAKINAPNANVGGLVYTSTGKSRWTVNDKGINLSGAQITAGNGKALGLLVCHGESLYLEFTEHWSKAYELTNISLTTTAAIFDELVAYTASSAANIMKNNENGIVSLATEQRVGVNTGTKCTTYVNRTTYGNGKTNGCSRYYYDLDQKIETVKTAPKDGWIDTPEELLIWSVYQYATGNLKDYFKFGDSGEVQYKIGGASADSPAKLDMKGLSYYPINLSVGNVTVQNANITFYNETIEKAESSNSNKSTVGNRDVHTQHYAMHSGLFHEQDNGEMTVNVKNVTFSGSIGKVADDASGVLFSGSVGGSKTDNVLHIYTMNLEQITLDGLIVYNIGATKAPMLFNQLGSYVTVSVDTVSAKNYASSGQKAAASSLIGDVGSGDGTQISISFSNIALPDKTTDKGGIFTRATLLNSFQYADDGVAVGTYNFYHKDDYTGNTHDHHNVTYGAEITDASDDTSAGTKEYKTLQQWYYDETLHGKENGIVKDKDDSTDFRAYLPYVAVAYNTKNHTHELKINQRVSNLTEGCGTYGHPYVITKASELIILAEYLAGGENAKPRKDWVVTITSDQNQLCSSAKRLDVSYQYNGTDWVQVKQDSGEWVETASPSVTLANAVMYRYLLSAYYDIQGETDKTGRYELTLNNFKGLGNTVYPFRGVITSSKGAIVKLLGSETANGFIPYSYGSVIKDISFSYLTQDGKGKALAYQKASTYYPQTCFGGVIGCIMGGDNIIDNVSVTMSNGWLTLTGEKKYLLQVGGYVGSVCGGGVIFRNMDGKSGLTDNMISGGSVAENATASLYVNPYVGRVLDGFAFSEGCEVANTNKNYKINELDTKDIGVLTTTGGAREAWKGHTYHLQTTIKNKQGLLLLSALVNSGACAGGDTSSNGGTYAYWGSQYDSKTKYKFGNDHYGKVRNANYNYIGHPEKQEAESDFKNAILDDQKAPGYAGNQVICSAETLDAGTNAPYLITKYCNKSTFYISGYQRRVSFVMADGTDYNMSDYGNGYQGISARYVSNALNGGNNDRVIPWVTTFDGNQRTLEVKRSTLEYESDDFVTVSSGGLYNLIQLDMKEMPDQDAYALSNLTIKDSEIFISYYNADGKETTGGNTAVGVGGFAGNNARNLSVNENNASATFKNVTIINSKFHSSGGAGGLMGNAGISNGDHNLNTLYGSGDNRLGINLIDCSYSKLDIYGEYAAGGFVGYICNNSQNNDKVKSSVLVKDMTDNIVGADSKIVAGSRYSDSYAAGIFGYVKTRLEINNITEQNVSISSTGNKGAAGGLIGKQENAFKITNALYVGTEKKYATISIKQVDSNWNENVIIGGIIGDTAISQDKTGTVRECGVKYVTLTEEKVSGKIGGIIGYVEKGKECVVEQCKIEHLNANGNWTGGIVGSTNAVTTITGCEVLGENTTNQIDLQGGYSVGGILGFVQGKDLVKIEQCKVDNAFIHATTNSNTYAGGFIANMNKSDNKINLFDNVIQNSRVQAGYVGGMVGIMHGTLNGSNLLSSNTSISGGGNGKGLLIGIVNDGLKNAYLSGVSLQKGTGTTNWSDLCGNSNQLKGKGYIAFADYDGAAMTAGSADSTAGTEKDLLGATPVFPYVTTSPKSTLSVQKGYDYLLYGDSASWTSEDQAFTLKAEKIWKDHTSAGNTKYVYSKTDVSEFNFSENVSTYNNMQPEHVDTNFPVLIVTAKNADNVMKDYLDIVTNGGYSEANKLKQVTAEAEVYSYDSAQKRFVYDSAEAAALQIKNQDGSIVFQAPIGYDNNRNRFTLLTVTFGTVKGHQYKVQVPLIVRRMLQVDFTATLNYGTHFKSTDYDNLTGHVLESFGNSVTAYLTYTYNSEKGVYAEYSWKNYVEAGGDATKVLEKQIIFAQDDPVPVGTQLTLVDCQDNNRRMYSYTITDADAKMKNTTVSFSRFTNPDGTAFASKSIGEVMGVQAEENAAGTFLETDKEGTPTDTEVTGAVSGVLPTVKIGEKYYRLAQSGETGGRRYKVTISEKNLSEAGKSKIKENYYLVITMPESAAGKANGAIQTDFESREIPYQINCELRGGGVDSQENTASTYQISSGYQQKLKDSSNLNQKELIEADRTLKICITDEIAFPKGQAYQIGDQLYLRFIGSLQNWITENGSQKVASAEFPAGTEGQVHFYIYTVDGDKRTYYSAVQSGSTIKWSTGSAKTPVTADGYLWTSDGGNMELPLSSDGSVANAISLQGVRDSILQNSGGDKTTGIFYVEAVLDAELPSVGLEVIPQTQLSADGSTPIDYAKITYTSQLSAEKSSLSYSNMKKTLQGDTKYYRQETDSAVLTYDADDVNQLGINPYDLGQNVDASKEHALIDTTAVYDLAGMRDLESTLLQSEGIRFTLKVLQKDSVAGRTEQYGEQIAGESTDVEGSILNKADEYLTVKLMGEENPKLTYQNGIWSWTIPQSSYVENHVIKTGSSFDGIEFMQAVQLQVKINNIESAEHYYSNYKVVMEAEILDAQGNVINATTSEDYLIYTLAKIRPEFVE